MPTVIQNDLNERENRRQILNFELYSAEVPTNLPLVSTLDNLEIKLKKALIKLRIMENVELYQKLGTEVKTLELKKNY